jgi:hypothetical protein
MWCWNCLGKCLYLLLLQKISRCRRLNNRERSRWILGHHSVVLIELICIWWGHCLRLLWFPGIGLCLLIKFWKKQIKLLRFRFLIIMLHSWVLQALTCCRLNRNFYFLKRLRPLYCVIRRQGSSLHIGWLIHIKPELLSGCVLFDHRDCGRELTAAKD